MRKAVKQSEKLAGEIAYWQEKLAPAIREVDPDDLQLILWSILRRKYAGKNCFRSVQKKGR